MSATANNKGIDTAATSGTNALFQASVTADSEGHPSSDDGEGDKRSCCTSTNNGSSCLWLGLCTSTYSNETMEMAIRTPAKTDPHLKRTPRTLGEYTKQSVQAL